MGKTTYKRVKGSQNLRQRLLLSTLASTAVIVEDIRSDHTWPGLRPHEVSLLRLLEKVCDDCVVEINETGTSSGAYLLSKVRFVYLVYCSCSGLQLQAWCEKDVVPGGCNCYWKKVPGKEIEPRVASVVRRAISFG